mgnify:CR=1 FL=1
MLSEGDIESFMTKVTYKKLARGEFFIKEGAIAKEVAFVVSGLFRSFYYSSNDEEVTYCFTFENTLLAAYSSYISQEPTAENIQAMTEVELLSIPREELVQLETSSSSWMAFSKFLAEQEYIKMEKRVFLLQKEAAERRYEDLMKHHPEYLQLIPLNQLASYLGITQRHLSRIRKALSN